MANPIRFFSRKADYAELSNFAPFGFREDDVHWATVEHYFQAAKFMNTGHRRRIAEAASPQQAKALGRSRAFAIHADWDERRETVMRHALARKFEHPDLRALLLGTGKRDLIEASPFDSYWGCGRSGKGRNRLGVLLMELREALKADEPNTYGL